MWPKDITMIKKGNAVLYFGTILSLIHVSHSCQLKNFGNGGDVCVCNASYCDYVGRLQKPKDKETFLVYTSNFDGLRLAKTTGHFGSSNNSRKKPYLWNVFNDVIMIDYNQKAQKIIGFGGAFTDSTGININLLGKKVKEHILRSYFSQDGIEYSLGRIPIGGTDFSTHDYSYDDGPEDMQLTNFALKEEDKKYKIPLIKEAKKLSTNLSLFASAWIAPKWMKTNNDYVGGEIKTEMYQTWADYHLRFLEAYKKNGIDIWGITTGNEPGLALFPSIKVPSSLWTAETMNKWISENLGPTIRKSKYSDLKILAYDDQRLALPVFAKALFKSNKTRNYVDGLAVHWYFDKLVPPTFLTETHNSFPDKFILGTEACEGSSILFKGPRLGDWSRALVYAKFIIQDLKHWVTGWTDWNMALNVKGGPTYIKNFVDSPIIVDQENEVFYKQPTFYALAHFSKFVPKDSYKIYTSKHHVLDVVAFKRVDGGTSIVILNEKSRSVPLIIKQQNRRDISLKITPKSITTIIHW